MFNKGSRTGKIGVKIRKTVGLLRSMRHRERQEDEDRFTSSLAGLAVALFLMVTGLYVMEKLAALSKLENCMLQGRMNCERIELSP
jgi:hypothetical protein